MPLAFLFFLLPLAEVYMFIVVGGQIGALRTVLLCVLTAIAGGMLVQSQGLNVMTRAQAQLNKGIIPAREMFDGLCLMVAGILLMVPGFVSDIIGFSLLISPLRGLLRDFLIRRFHLTPEAQVYRETTIIEGSYERVDDPKERLSRPDGRDTDTP